MDKMLIKQKNIESGGDGDSHKHVTAYCAIKTVAGHYNIYQFDSH